MIWSTWRQHRSEALAAGAVLIGAAALVVWAVTLDSFAHGTGEPLSQAAILTLAVLPALAGVFMGAPLLARDLEQGTHRLVWTQGTTRTHWLATKLLLVFAVVMVAAALLGALTAVAVDSQQIVLRGGTTIDATTLWNWFDVQGPAFAGYVAFALALGIALGALIGRTYPAMAATLGGYVAVRVAVGALLRPRYLPPLHVRMLGFETTQRPAGQHDPWELDFVYQTVRGRTVSLDQALQMGAPNGTLASHGLVGWVYYQPGDRFWLFQGIETAIFVALAVLLVGVSWHWVTRRLG
jgi:hypothetical protein